MPEVDNSNATIEKLTLTKIGYREMPPKADVVLEKDLDIVDAVFEHCQAVDADTEGESADSFGVIVHETVDGRIDHAGAEEFDPGCALALRTRSATGGRARSAAAGTGAVKL